MYQAVILSYCIDFDEQIPLESPLSSPIDRFRFTTFPKALVSPPMGLGTESHGETIACFYELLHTSMSWFL